jgi:hypothetical protein
MKRAMFFTLMLLTSIGFLGCKKDKADPNEEELITTVRVKLTDKNGGAVSSFEFKDLDGEGGAAPTRFDEIVMQKGRAYDCSLEILNESVSPADNITAEILAEANDHQFYFVATDGLVSVTNLNNDGKGLPLGTTSTWTASGNAGTGTITITLKHKPGVKAAGDAVTIGETDIALSYRLKIQ